MTLRELVKTVSTANYNVNAFGCAPYNQFHKTIQLR